MRALFRENRECESRNGPGSSIHSRNGGARTRLRRDGLRDQRRSAPLTHAGRRSGIFYRARPHPFGVKFIDPSGHHGAKRWFRRLVSDKGEIFRNELERILIGSAQSIFLRDEKRQPRFKAVRYWVC